MFCFPRNVDSVAFYTGRSDLKSCRTKVSQELVEALIRQDRSVVLFTHRHSLETFKQVLPPQLRVTEATAVKHSGSGATFIDCLVGDGPWGLCHVAVIERVPVPPPERARNPAIRARPDWPPRHPPARTDLTSPHSQPAVPPRATRPGGGPPIAVY